MNTCLYVGSVAHRRHDAIEHGFRKSLYMVYLDLDELSSAFGGAWLWGAERVRWMSFRSEDHLVEASRTEPHRSLADVARDTVARETGRRPAGPVRLLTGLRCAGLAFNPVSFFYCFDEREELEAIVAEVNNTPWGEQHCYVVDPRARRPRPVTPKAFHVSPFQGMDQEYRWRVDAPGEHLVVGIENRSAGDRVFDAVLTLERRPWTRTARALALARHPAMPFEVLASIYWQAARLFLQKRAPVHPHPSGAAQPMEISS